VGSFRPVTAPANRKKLARSDLTAAGIQRRRCGRGFRYLGPGAEPVRDPETLARIKALVIPPAWEDVWICADPDGHIQAVGTDSADRRQYRYHDLWRKQRDRRKHDRMLEFGAVLPRIRKTVSRHITGTGLGRERVLAASIRLIDLGFFRPGGEEYAAENATFGLATIRREHVTCAHGELVFDYTAKGSQHREQAVADDDVQAVVHGLKRRRRPSHAAPRPQGVTVTLRGWGRHAGPSRTPPFHPAFLRRDAAGMPSGPRLARTPDDRFRRPFA
jgi:DNA topoisomerase IB